MKEARIRALIPAEVETFSIFSFVIEMKEARIRALIHHIKYNFGFYFYDRNEGSPYKGIDTLACIIFQFYLFGIEMKEARIRALILFLAKFINKLDTL